MAGLGRIGWQVSPEYAHEIHKPILYKRGHFISGKFDQFQRHVPYSVFINAFQEFTNLLLGETSERLLEWKDKILEAVGNNGQVVVDVIPEIGLIIGAQAPVPELGSAETQNRFILTFQNFVRVLATKAHPLVVFLDDLQWADMASLNLLKALITDPNSRHILFLGAYRDNEINSSHPLMRALDEIQLQNQSVVTLELQPLEAGSLCRLLADTLLRDEPAVGNLSELILEKTGGNPFFVTQLLFALYTDQLLQFDESLRVWAWEMKQIEARGMTDNVIELMLQKIRKLPDKTREMLQICSCIGNTFQLEILSITSGLSLPNVVKALWPALAEELLLPMGDSHKLLIVLNDGDDTKGLNEYFKFQHDRIQQAAYETIEQGQGEALHLKIGRLLLKHIPENEFDENIFNISAQLNAGRKLINEEKEQLKLAQLNLIAGKKALESSAFKTALDISQIGLELLPENSWKEYYELSYELHKLCAHCEYLNVNYERSDYIFQVILKNVKTNIEKARLYAIQLVQFASRAMGKEGFDMGRKSIRLCGVDFPEDEDIAAAIPRKMKDVENLIQGRGIKRFEDIPQMNNEAKAVALDNLVFMMAISFAWGNINALSIGALTAIELILNHGENEFSAQAYVWYGVFITTQKKYNESYEFAKMGYELSERYALCPQKSLTNNMCAIIFFHWREGFSYSNQVLKNGYKIGLEQGDIMYANINIANIGTIMLLEGRPLIEVAGQLDSSLENAYRNRFFVITDNVQSERNFVGFMMDPNSGFDLEPENYPPEQMKRIQTTYSITYYMHYRMQKEFWSGNYAKALERAREEKQEGLKLPGFPVELEHYFFKSLIIAQLLTEKSGAGENEQKTLFAELEIAEQKMKLWAELCPQNNLHRYLLMQAEKARLKQNYTEALKLYEEAIIPAKTNGFLHHEALINELCARSWLEQDLSRYAVTPMLEAHYLYKKWGALRKVQELERKYPELLSDLAPDSLRRKISIKNEPDTMSTSSTERISEALDLKTVIKASRAISGEINLKQLLKRLMDIIIENAGAQKGLLILKRDEQWLIEAEVNSAGEQTRVLEGLLLKKHETVPESLIRFVMRSGKKVVIVDAAQNNDFSQDQYIRKIMPRSVLCMALKREHRVEGVLYLENNSAPGAFKPENVSILKILLAQAIISIQNAYLFQSQKEAEEQVRNINAELEERVRIRTEALQVANKELETFSYSVSHDLRAPLRTIIGFIKILREDHMESLNEDILHYFRRIEHSSEKMNDLIYDLLNLSKIKRHQLEYQKFDGVELCKQIFADLETGEPERKVEIHIQDSLEITGDIKLVRIIFQNLLSNSWKYSAKKDTTIIDVGHLNDNAAHNVAERFPGHTEDQVYFVRDNGAGFDMKYADTIFAAFKRLHSPRDFEGTGIGLATVQRIVNRHGGQIWAEGKVNEGATFYFTLGRNTPQTY